MAINSMGSAYSEMFTGPEILYNSEYVGYPVTIGSEFFNDDGICVAGTPLSWEGTYSNDSGAAGVLLHDVHSDRPQGTLVIGGYINTKVAEDWMGDVYSNECVNALKNVVFVGREPLE